MSRLAAILSSKSNLPRPEADWDFTDFSKIQPGAGANDVAGWTGTSLKSGISTVDLTQTTAAAQPVFDTDHIVFDGSDYLEGMPTQAGDFTYIVKFETSHNATGQIILGGSVSPAYLLSIQTNGDLVYRSSFNSLMTYTANLNNGSTYIVGLTRIGTLVTMYVDGINVFSFTDTGDFLVERLGTYSLTGAEFTGNMENLLIYPTALTDAEVAAKTASLA